MMNHRTETSVFGFWLYIMSDCVLFAGLFATYAVLRGQTAGGAGIGDILSLPYVLAETLFLLTSSFAAGLALLAVLRQNKWHAILYLVATLTLGLSFLGMEWLEFGRLIAEGHGPAASGFLSGYFGLVGTHGLHVFAGSVWMLALIIAIAAQGLTEGNTRKLMYLSLFWHFLDIVWIFIFTFVYLFGAL